MTTPLELAVAARGKRWLEAEDEPVGTLDLAGDGLAEATSAAVREATVAALERHLGDHYTRRPGIAPLCKAVARHLATFGLTVNPDNEVVITGGPQESRFVALRVLAVGRTVYVPTVAPWPAYAAALSFAGAAAARFDPEGELPEAQRAVLLLPTPNPATGQAYAAETLARLAAWAAAADLAVIADEAAAPLLRPDRAHVPFASLPAMAERTLTLGSFASVPGLDAWNVAWFAGPKSCSVPVRDLKQAMTICSSAASQYAALGGWEAPDASTRAGAEGRIAALAALLARLGLPYAEPHTIAYLVADVSALGGGAAVAAACLRRGVRVADGAGFGSPGTIRITVIERGFDDALVRLEGALAELAGARA